MAYIHSKKLGVMLKFKLKKGFFPYALFQHKEMTSASKTSYPIGNASVNSDWWHIYYDVVDVRYTDSYKHPSMMDIKGDGTYSIPQYFALEKRSDWSYEKETRFRAVLETLHPEEHQSSLNIEDTPCLFATLNFKAIEKISIVFDPWLNKDTWEGIFKSFLSSENIPTAVEYENSSLYGRIY